MIEDVILTCKKEGSFILHSGEKSSYLFDVMELIGNKDFHHEYSYFIDDEFLVGIEFGGAILAALGSRYNTYKLYGDIYTDNQFGIVRKDGTLYGYIPDDYTLIDDVVTTENSIKNAIKQIGKKPTNIKTIVDRRKIKTLDIESMLIWEE